jgi:2-phospho-L-lactate guanylyltransferase
MAVIPADIPHISGALIDTVVGMTPDGGVTLLPAVRDGGTNMLCMRPPHLLAPRFGPNSFQRHYRAAQAAGAVTQVRPCQRTGYDIDRPHDLETFLGFASRTRTHAYLAGLGIPERCAEARRAAFPAELAQVPL